jgi:hypothetical protein
VLSIAASSHCHAQKPTATTYLRCFLLVTPFDSHSGLCRVGRNALGCWLVDDVVELLDACSLPLDPDLVIGVKADVDGVAEHCGDDGGVGVAGVVQECYCSAPHDLVIGSAETECFPDWSYAVIEEIIGPHWSFWFLAGEEPTVGLAARVFISPLLEVSDDALWECDGAVAVPGFWRVDFSAIDSSLHGEGFAVQVADL